MSLIKESILSFIGLVISNISYVIIGVLVASALGPTGKGAWTIVTLLVNYIALISTLGLDAANIYYLGQGKKTRDQIFSMIFYAWLGISLLSIGVTVPILLMWGEPLLTKGQFDNNLVIGAALIAPLFLGFRLLTTYLQGCLKIAKYNFLIMFQLCIQIIGLCLSLFMLHSGIWGIFVAYLFSLLAANFVAMAFIRLEGIHISFKEGITIAPQMFRYGIKGYFGNMIQFLNYKIDILLVNLMLGVSATGIYSVAVNLSSLCWFFSYALSISLFPRVSSGLKDSKKLIQKSARVCISLTILAGLILALVAKHLIRFLYGVNFEAAMGAMYLLLPGVVIFVYGRIVANYFLGKGRPLINSAISLISLILNIPLNFLWIPKFGIKGAAMATSISYLIISILSYIMFKYYPSDIQSFNIWGLLFFRIKKQQNMLEIH